ncbi:MAG: hypothetical protein GF308_20325 [Candidatus Heimdallarchaeota archaeon]|nr:hypothetical protein [Candidatus Heimdallarchaeota archaeon]
MVNWHRLQIGEKLVDELTRIDVAIFSKKNPVYISEALKEHVYWRSVDNLLEEISKLAAKRTQLVGWKKEYRMAAAIFGLIDRRINDLVDGCVRAIIASQSLLVVFRDLLKEHRDAFSKEFSSVKMGTIGVEIDRWMNECSRLERMIEGYREVNEDRIQYDKKFAAEYIEMAKKVVELVETAIKTDTDLGKSLAGYVSRRRIAPLLREAVLTPVIEDKLKEYMEIKHTWRDIGVEGIIQISRELEDIAEEIEFLKIAAKTDRRTKVVKKYQDFQAKLRLLEDLHFSTNEVKQDVSKRVETLVNDLEEIAESVRFDDSLTLNKAMSDTLFLRKTKELYNLIMDDLFGEILSRYRIIRNHVNFEDNISKNFEQLLAMDELFSNSESPADMLEETERLIRHGKLIDNYYFELDNSLLKDLKVIIQLLVNLANQGFPVEHQVKDITIVADRINTNREITEKDLAEIESKVSAIADEARSMIVKESTDLERILGAKIISPRETPTIAQGYRNFKQSLLEFEDMEEDVENLKASVHSLITSILTALEAEESTIIECPPNEELYSKLNEIRWSLLQPFSPITTLTDDLEELEQKYNEDFNAWVEKYHALFNNILSAKLLLAIKDLSLRNLTTIHQQLTENLIKWMSESKEALNKQLEKAMSSIQEFTEAVVESRIGKLIEQHSRLQEKPKLSIEDIQETVQRKKKSEYIVENLRDLIKEAPQKLDQNPGTE